MVYFGAGEIHCEELFGKGVYGKLTDLTRDEKKLVSEKHISLIQKRSTRNAILRDTCYVSKRLNVYIFFSE